MISRAQDAWNKIAALALLRDGHLKNAATMDNFRIQKLGFRSEVRGQEKGFLPAFFKFFRYNQGPYSKELANQVRSLEEREFVDSETRCLTWRGEYLLEYVEPEIRRYDAAIQAIQTIRTVCEEMRSLHSSRRLVQQTYEMRVPVAAFGNKIMRVEDIPMHKDIIVPDAFPERQMLSAEMIDDLEEEWQIPPASLDPANPELAAAVDAGCRAALAR